MVNSSCVLNQYSNDPVGARHAVALTLDYAKEAPAEVAPNVKRFIPHLKGKEAVYLTDTIARVYFTSLSATIGISSEGSSSPEFFQCLIQNLLDIHPRVAFEAMIALARFPWPKLEKATVLNISPEVPDGATQLHETIANPIPVLQAITSRLSTTLPMPSPAVAHASCRVIRTLAAAYHEYLASSDQPVNQQQLSSPTPTTKFPSLDLRDNIGAHPLASLTNPLVVLLSAPSAFVRAQALKVSN